MASATHDLVVIGAGPGGYVAAIRAAQLGMNVACVEREKALGGTCLRIGCIPSKALLESSELYREAREGLGAHGVQVEKVQLDLAAMMKRKDDVVKANTSGVEFLFKKNKVTRYVGTARFSGPQPLLGPRPLARSDTDSAGGGVRLVVENGRETTEIAAKHVIIATGSLSAPLKGVAVDGDRIGTSTEALTWSEVPGHLVVIGAGAIGLEMGSVWSRLGSKVTVLEYFDRILPGMDAEIAAEALKVFKKQGLEFKLGARVTSAKCVSSAARGGSVERCVVEAEGMEPIECDRVLLAVGRKPCTDGLGLDAVGLQLDEKGRIPVDEHFRTKVDGVYAIGDVIRGPMLAHKAEDEGIACVEAIATGFCHVNYDAIPNVVYTAPEVASVGKTEEELKAAKVEYRKGAFPFSANGRARALGHTEGRVKMLADAKSDRILGVHILGPRAGDLIAEAAAAIEFGATSEDIARTSHAHPTLAEAVREAAFAVDRRALHI